MQNIIESPTVTSCVNRIIHGDCIEVMAQMPAESVDLVVTDPPYLVNYRSRDGRSILNDCNGDWLKPAFSEVYRVLRRDSFCVSFYGWTEVEKFMLAWKDVGFYPVGHIVWKKPYASRKGFLRACHESAYLLAKGRPSQNGGMLPDVLRWEYTGNHLPPNQKPVMAIEPLIVRFSKPGDIVLDPFCGSGTTAEAAKNLGRRFIGIEKDKKYYQTAAKRITNQETIYL